MVYTHSPQSLPLAALEHKLLDLGVLLYTEKETWNRITYCVIGIKEREPTVSALEKLERNSSHLCTAQKSQQL